METKICTKCGIEKKLESFRKNGKYYRGECKECEKKYQKNYIEKHGKEIYERRKEKAKIYRELHKQKNKEYQKEYYLNNKEKHNSYSKKYNETYIRPKESVERHRLKTKEWKNKNKEHIKNYERKYNEEHIEEKRIRDIKWRRENKERVRIYQQKDYERRKNDPILRLQRNIRNLINDSFNKHKYGKNKHTEEILGCKVDEFILHLLETFKSNYGYEWDKIEPVHIDHIIPLATAKTEEDVIRLCHYTNLQLLKAKDNMSKSDKLDWKLH